MKILVCHNRYQQPGGEDVVFEAETALLESAGHEVVRYERHNDDVAAMGRLDLARRTVSNPYTADALALLIERERPDVVHCHNTFPLISPAAYAAAARHGVATVQTLHNFRPVCPSANLMRDGRICEQCLGRRFAWPGVVHGCYRNSAAATAVVAGMSAWHRLCGTWANAVDRYVTPTAFVRDRFVAGGFPADRIEVKPNFVAADPGPGDGAGGHAVFVGRLAEEKGVRFLLEAWRRLEDGPPLHVLGDGPLAEEVRSAAVASDGRIRWLGHQPRARVMKEIASARFLVMPSVWYETFGLCIAEAFAAGTPVLASRLGAMAELVEHGRTGFLFPHADASALAQAVARATADPHTLRAMRPAARASYEARFTPEGNLDRLVAIYGRAIGRRRETAGARGKADRSRAVMLNESESAAP